MEQITMAAGAVSMTTVATARPIVLPCCASASTALPLRQPQHLRAGIVSSSSSPSSSSTRRLVRGSGCDRGLDFYGKLEKTLARAVGGDAISDSSSFSSGKNGTFLASARASRQQFSARQKKQFQEEAQKLRAGSGGELGATAEEEIPDGTYVLVSSDPDDLDVEIKRIERENELLRERLQRLNNEVETVAAERKASVDVNRPRRDSLPPFATSSTSSSSTGTATSAMATSETGLGEEVGELGVKVQHDLLDGTKLSRIVDEEAKKKTSKAMSIVFVTAEAAPYSKTGGLGDVCGALPLALAARGHRVMVVSPRYLNGVNDKVFDAAFDCQCRVKLSCFNAQHEVAFFHEYRGGVDWVFVDHPSYHRSGTPYGDTRGAFGDNQFRFTLLCLAACEAPLVLPLGDFVYGDKCLFVANDWHASLVPVYLAAKYRAFGVYTKARCVLAIHNLLHQGVEPGVTFENLGLPTDWYGAMEWVFPTWARKHALDKGEAVNHLKGAIVTSDRILTVSQGYAWEITTKEGGWGLDGLLRTRHAVINGITNGVDIKEWNPATDRHIPSQYTVDDLKGKAECKAALQKELGLPIKPETPLIGFIGRLDYQKGPDLIQSALPELMTEDVQMVMLGSGDPEIEAWMGWAEGAFREKFRGWVGFSVPVAHRITAGCDILLMPSRFEPCGLNQLYAMRYGTVPVAHSTGGLRDTIEDFNPFAKGVTGSGTGWTFSPATKDAMMETLWTTILTYRQYPDTWQGLMRRGMEQDFSWDRAAGQYEQVFEWAMLDAPYA